MRKVWTCAVLILAACPRLAVASVSPELAIKAILGEAEGEGPRGMLAVACAIRNRGTLRGVYGVNAPRVKQGKIKPEIQAMARRAWEESAKKDITGGADHWHNLKREGHRQWTRVYRVTVTVGNHVFFRSKK